MKKQTSSIYESINERETKKEIEAKWKRLLARTDKSPEAGSSVISTGAKVIRRRKGKKDLPIA